ncbi:MAG: hypothetical protein AAGB93_24760 [Planctomycetota bacterium]
MKNALLTLVTACALWLVPASCSNGGGDGGGGGNLGGGGTARAWAIENAGATGAGTDLLMAGDMFIGENDLAAATAIGDRIWARLTGPTTWIGNTPLNTYQFYDDSDPVTAWGRAFRYTGFSVVAGPIIGPTVFYGTGTYVAANGQAFDAMIVHTWDDVYWELFVIQDGALFTHAVQHVTGLPIVEDFSAN